MNDEKLMNQKEAKAWLKDHGVCPNALKPALEEGQISTVVIGRREYIPESELKKAITPIQSYNN